MIDRRQIFGIVAAFAAGPALAQTGLSRMTAYAFSFAGLKGGDIKLADYAGKPVLVVNTASQCGYTPQYAGLQELWKRYHERGLTAYLQEMTVRPPHLSSKIANIWTANPTLEYELAQEKASALGRLGRGLEAALEALRSFDAGVTELNNESRRERRALVAHA